MCKNAFVICLFLIAALHFDGLDAVRRRTTTTTTTTTEPPQPQTPKEYLDNTSGLSTFGIIAIIFFVIVCCLVFYYGIICYPFLCRDEKKYRFMDVSSTLTTATSRSIQSIENFQVDQKH